MTDTRRLSIVIPVYNSAPSIGTLMRRLTAALEQMGAEYEVILVNDGSSDSSWQEIRALGAGSRGSQGGRGGRLQAIDMMRNYGQHNALLAGIRAARGDVVVTMDDDLQHPPEEIPKLLARLDEGYDVVYGTPLEEQHGWWRDLASQITKMALKSATGAKTARQVSAFRAFRTRLRDAFAGYQSPFVSIDVLLTWATTRFTAVAVRHDPRLVGQSHYGFRKLVAHALNMMTGFSTWPLRLASLIGFAFTLVGLAAFVFVVWSYLAAGGSVPGFPFLASMIAIFSGAQLFALGIMGEYLSRMHFRMMERPTYAVQEHLTVDPEE